LHHVFPTCQVVQISRNYSTHMQLGSDATATEMGRESN
jgi:hypothetical protein